MAISVFDLFTIGIGPSSSHTVGPMRAARRFAEQLDAANALHRVHSVTAELFGSLGLTGKAHGSDRGVMLGLEGESPETIDPEQIPNRMEKITSERALRLLGKHPVEFVEERHLTFHKRQSLPLHPNGMRFTARDAGGDDVEQRVYYSVGGGFIVTPDAEASDTLGSAAGVLPFPFSSGDEFLEMGRAYGVSLSHMTFENEKTRRPESEIRTRLLTIWHTMQRCIQRGCRTEGTLPGRLGVRRRAPHLYRELVQRPEAVQQDPLHIMDWVNVYAIAVNEENAAGGRVVTAPTNGAAGIIPAVLHYYTEFCSGASDEGVIRFLLAAGAIGILYKENASIAGAEVGCQGEVGVACSMAAAGLAEALGGRIQQVEEAAEIGMEHNLGLTCDPVAGLVQIPCIERNAMGAVKAINACRLALRGTGHHHVSLDKVIKTMRETGADMKTKYKESARGGLAVNVVEC